MRSYTYILSILLFSLVFSTGCKPDEPEVALNISVSSINASADQNTYQVNVTTTAQTYSVTSDATWCIPTYDSKIKRFSVKVEKNEQFEVRKAILTIVAATKTVYLNITQAAGVPPVYTSTKRDSLALIALNNGAVKWDKTVPMDKWKGIKVQKIDGHRRVIELNIPGANIISGSISDSLPNLTALMYLDVAENQLTGTIPTLSDLDKLILIDLKNNKLTGSIPLLPTSLVYVSLGQNNLSGTLPEQIKDLPNLSILDLGLNNLSGEIPAAWNSLSKITYFYLYGNQLTNSIPAFISSYAMLEALALDYNMLTGEIPAGLGNIASLKKLTLHQNLLSGTIPTDLLNNPHWEVWKDFVEPQQNNVVLNAKRFKLLNKNISVHNLPDKSKFYKFYN